MARPCLEMSKDWQPKGLGSGTVHQWKQGVQVTLLHPSEQNGGRLSLTPMFPRGWNGFRRQA